MNPHNPSTRVPPLSANIGQACYHCFKGKNEGTLQRCSGCFRVSYCGPACQKANWSSHKGICKAFKALEAKHGADVIIPFIAAEPNLVTDEEHLNKTVNMVAQIEMNVLLRELGRELTVIERNMVGWQPRCLACGRSDFVARVEGAKKQKPALLPSAHPCPRCAISFCCSDAHWDAVRAVHGEVPCQDGWDGLTQCGMNLLYAADVKQALSMAEEGGAVSWAPERTVPEWTSLRGINWYDSFMQEMKKMVAGYGAPDSVLKPMLRGATEGLSMPMTILWALELLHTDLDWTKKDTLNIHVLGAAQIEAMTHGTMFEEILHRLPHVKHLKLTLCGPELNFVGGANSQSLVMDTCPECSRKKRKRTHIIEKYTYHQFISRSGDSFVKPDLAVAFNSGCSQENVLSWKETLVALTKHKVPTVFTAYNREEAMAEAKLLEAAGAVLHPELGPIKNPWASLMPKMEPNKVTGFYAVNGWLAGGFK